MDILFTGGSSFTGYWFIRQLAEAGHEVRATFTRGSVADYADGGVRGARVELLASLCTPVWNCTFGDDAFMEALRDLGGGVLCHHAADVTNYKSPDFDAAGAVCNNTRNGRAVLRSLAESGGRLLLTNSVFAGGEGAGSVGAVGELPHFSPYGLSKAMTAEFYRYHAAELGVNLGEFVIPNPFGPYEEPRFTNYLVKTWFGGKVAGCNTPAYVRDNIHVELLGRAYADFAGRLDAAHQKLGPCGYIESQGAFAERFAQQMRPRLGLGCALELADQTEFAEPRIRINTDAVDAAVLGFDEARAWDAVADFYAGVYAR